jgi:hypothetical protein
MLAFAVVVVLGYMIGRARGGRLEHVTGARLSLLPLVWLAFGLQAGAQFVPDRASMVAYGMVVASYAGLFAFAGANWRVAGMILIALGAAMNYAVILANQGMPISAEAAAKAGVSGDLARLVIRGKHFIVTDSAPRLEFLSDIIPLWRQPSVASVGDLVLWAGIMLVVQALMRPPARRAPRVRRSEHVPGV